MSAISGTRRAMKEMADGTIRVQIDIDPSCRGDFLSLFPNIDMPVALAPLRADFEQQAPAQEKAKGGPLARLAGQMCQNPEFQAFAVPYMTSSQNAEDLAADWLRTTCGIESRAELDHNPQAAACFHDKVRKPFLEWKEGRN